MSDTCKPCETGFPEPVQPYGPMPFTPPVPDTACGYSVIQSVNDCIMRLNQSAATYNEALKNCYSAYAKLVKAGETNGAYYTNEEVHSGTIYSAEHKVTAKLVTIQPCDIKGNKISVNLALSNDSTNNFDLTQSIQQVSYNNLCDVIATAQNDNQQGWFGNVIYKGSVLPTTVLEEYFTLGFDKDGKMHIYANTIPVASLCNDGIINSMGVYGYLVQDGKAVTDFTNYPDYQIQTSRIGLGQNEETGVTYIVILDTATGTGEMTIQALADIMVQAGCTIGAEICFGEYTSALYEGKNIVTNSLYTPACVYWYVSKAQTYNTEFETELAKTIQMVNQNSNAQEDFMKRNGDTTRPGSDYTFYGSQNMETGLSNGNVFINGEQIGFTNVDGDTTFNMTLNSKGLTATVAGKTPTPSRFTVNASELDMAGNNIGAVSNIIGRNGEVYIRSSTEGGVANIRMTENDIYINPGENNSVTLGSPQATPITLSNVKDPITSTDAATKSYVDTEIEKLPQLPANWITRDGGTFNVGAALNFPLNEQGYNTTIAPNNLYLASMTNALRIKDGIIDISIPDGIVASLSQYRMTLYDTETGINTAVFNGTIQCFNNNQNTGAPLKIATSKLSLGQTMTGAGSSDPVVLTGIANPSDDNDAVNLAYLKSQVSPRAYNHTISTSQMTSTNGTISNGRAALLDYNNRSFMRVQGQITKNIAVPYMSLTISNPLINTALQSTINRVNSALDGSYTITSLRGVNLITDVPENQTLVSINYNNQASGVIVELYFNNENITTEDIDFTIELIPQPSV